MWFRVALCWTEEGYSISCPALLGCWSQGGTVEEALENIKLSIIEYSLLIGAEGSNHR